MVLVVQGKIVAKCSEEKQKILRVNWRFELSRVPGTKGELQ